MAFESDWAYLKAALEDLQGYVVSEDLYRPLNLAHKPGSAQAPLLTIGNLALTLTRLSSAPRLSAPPAGGQLAELNSYAQRVEAVRSEWRSNWSNKAAKEFSSRLNLWQQYLRELRGDPRGQAAYYANEVRQRTILQLLLSEMLGTAPAHEQDQLTMLDGILRGLIQPGPFIWEGEVQPAFPEKDYWFLYAQVNR